MKLDARKPERTPTPVLKKGEHRGRNGEVLRRDAPKTPNPFDFPDDIKEPGWSYQWCRSDVYGSSEFSEISVMLRAGWRHVNPNQLNGYFAHQCKDKDFVEAGGLTLMERPAGMTEEAREEAQREANRHFMRQLDKRFGDDTPLPSGIESMMRMTHADPREAAPSDFKPTYGRVVAPAGDNE